MTLNFEAYHIESKALIDHIIRECDRECQKKEIFSKVEIQVLRQHIKRGLKGRLVKNNDTADAGEGGGVSAKKSFSIVA